MVCVTTDVFSEMGSSIPSAAKIGFPGFGAMRTGEVCNFSGSLLRTADRRSSGETSSKATCFTGRSYCFPAVGSILCPFPGITAFAALPGSLPHIWAAQLGGCRPVV